jgi:hypothetical protein
LYLLLHTNRPTFAIFGRGWIIVGQDVLISLSLLHNHLLFNPDQFVKHAYRIRVSVVASKGGDGLRIQLTHTFIHLTSSHHLGEERGRDGGGGGGGEERRRWRWRREAEMKDETGWRWRRRWRR